MKKVYRLTGLDCANCATKLENKIKSIKGVNSASVNFMMMKLNIDIDDNIYDEVLEVVKKEAKKIDGTELH